MPRLQTTQATENESSALRGSRQLSTPPEQTVPVVALPVVEASPFPSAMTCLRLLRLSTFWGVAGVLYIHWSGIWLTSAAASGVAAVGVLLNAAAALPPMHRGGLRDGLRHDTFAFSPFARQSIEISFNILVAAGLLIECFAVNISAKGMLFATFPFVLMAVGSLPKLLSLRPGRAASR